MSLTHDKIKDALQRTFYATRYETRAGRVFYGCPVSSVPAGLREARWNNVSRIDAYELERNYKFEVVQAQYIAGARPTGRFVDCIVISEPTAE